MTHSRLFRVGDRVEVRVPNVSIKIGQIESFVFSYDYLSRLDTPKPGLYSLRGAANIHVTEGSTLPNHKLEWIPLYMLKHVVPLDPQQQQQRLERDVNEFVQPIPEYEIWEHDHVVYRESDEARVTRLYYIFSNGREPLIRLRLNTGKTQVMAETREVQLLARGNLWNHYHGQPLTPFATLYEELEHAFAVHQVKTPVQGLVSSRSEAVAAVKCGVCHTFRAVGETEFQLLVVADHEFGARLASYTLSLPQNKDIK